MKQNWKLATGVLTKKEAASRRARAKQFLKFRVDRQMSQTALAEVLGVSRRTISSVENGEATPHAEMLRKFEALKQRYQETR